MANWTGSYVCANSTGTVTSATATTLTKTAAGWPTGGGNHLDNFTVYILTGTGAGQNRVISSNTSSVLTVSSAWTTTPDATSTYEIVLLLSNGDHITGTIDTNTTCRMAIADSATVYFDGLYSLRSQGSSITNFTKTETTLSTFEPNNKTVQGKSDFWREIGPDDASFTGTYSIAYIKLIGGNRFSAAAVDALSTMSTIKRIWMEQCDGGFGTEGGATPTVNQTMTEIFMRGKGQGNDSGNAFNFNSVSSSTTQTFLKIWIESGKNVPLDYHSTGPSSQVICRCVMKDTFSVNAPGVGTSKTFRFEDCYFVNNQPTDSSSAQGLLDASSTSAWTTKFMRNVYYYSRVCSSGAGANSAKFNASFNDYSSKFYQLNALFNCAASTMNQLTSDNDYISGMTAALPSTVDPSTATTSTASPVQYSNLTATRTNVKAVRNRPHTIDNIVVGTPTASACVITFDAVNGAVSGQGSTTVNSDSASGQAVLNVASVTGFEVGEIVEINYGGARSEEKEISSIGASSLTMTANLTFTHTAAQADTVKKQLRHYGLPFIKYGTATGVYTMQTALPAVEDWGLVYCNIVNTYQGKVHAWKQYGHSVTLAGLSPKTIYYAKPGYYTPDGTEVLDAEQTFVTLPESTIDYYSIEGAWSVDDSQNFLLSFWLEKNGTIITTLLGAGSYTVYDYAEAAVSGLTESGITANADGVYKITPAAGSALSVSTHFRIKASIIYNTETKTGYIELSNISAVIESIARQTKSLLFTGTGISRP